MTPQEVLLAAADGIESHEWCRGANFVDQDGQRWMLDFLDAEHPEPVAACATGAICLVGQEDIEARNYAISLLERYLAEGDREIKPCVSKWNDDRRRTKEEVVSTMRKAACG